MKIAALFLILTMSLGSAKLISRAVDYQDEKGAALEGYLAYDDATAEKRPGVLVVHDWKGISATTKKRADMLAQLGYVAFAVDVYGKDDRPTAVPGYVKAMTPFKEDRMLFRERERAAYQTLLKQPQVDQSRIAAIGYCFGGTGVVEMARDGLPLKGVVSFHGGLDARPLSEGRTIQAKVLALCGADDPLESQEDLAAFEQQLRENKVDYQIVKYGHAEHAFTDPGADAMHVKGVAYNAEADHRSWQAMQDFFNEIFGPGK